MKSIDKEWFAGAFNYPDIFYAQRLWWTASTVALGLTFDRTLAAGRLIYAVRDPDSPFLGLRELDPVEILEDDLYMMEEVFPLIPTIPPL